MKNIIIISCNKVTGLVNCAIHLYRTVNIVKIIPIVYHVKIKNIYL